MAHGLGGAVVVAALAVGACRPTSSPSTGSARGSGEAVAAVPVDAKPVASIDALRAPDAAASALPEPVDVKSALAELPEMKVDPMIMPATTADGRQVHGTWCLPGTGADGVVTDLAASLTNAGWTNVTTRGDAAKAGVSAERDGYRASYVVSASTANACRAPGHYFASLTMFRVRGSST